MHETTGSGSGGGAAFGGRLVMLCEILVGVAKKIEPSILAKAVLLFVEAGI